MSQTSPSTLLVLALAGAALASTPSIAQAGAKAYVGNFADNTVSVIDASAGNVVSTIPVAAGPHGMAISAMAARSTSWERGRNRCRPDRTSRGPSTALALTSISARSILT
jgi:YVTN family beta-propeller protein